MKRLIWILILLGGLYFAYTHRGSLPLGDVDLVSASNSAHADQVLGDAFREQRSNFQIEGEGVVTRILPDDTKGSRHQRFILRLSSNQTLLIAHNIDLAPRVSGIGVGDRVQFNGEYEWNSQGGVIHWTHHDPGGQHPAGWLRHGGSTYQ